MKKQKKVLALVLCAVMLVASSVLATMAYLTSTVGPVTNTFTVGSVGFDESTGAGLDEAKVDEYGVVQGNARVTENEYKLVPGHTYVKDPTVHIADDSEDAWLFVTVDNGLVAIEGENTIEEQMTALGWTLVEGNVYKYGTAPVKAGANIKVFETLTLANDADIANLVDTDNDGVIDANIVVKACAVQADGLSQDAAAEKCVWDVE